MKMHLAALIAATAILLRAQAPPVEDKPDPAEADLRQRVSEAGNSPIEFMRALEKHLEKFPNSPQKTDIERALVKAAVEAKDNRRILLYGERVLAQDSSDLLVLERVTRLLLANEDKESNERALAYAKRFHAGFQALEKEKPKSGRIDAQLRDQLDEALGRALVFQARATGNLGNPQEAIELARKGYELRPTAEAAREVGRWLAKLDRVEEALAYYADAFTIPDARVTDAERATTRARLAELYRLKHPDETGLGDIVLQAYDRTTQLLNERKLRLKQVDPNAQVSDPMEFTLAGVDGGKLALASLKGKVVVLDFWATWCGPCRVQYPLYEKVKEKFRDRKDVVFLGINTDEERSLVPGFLKEMKWNKAVYYEDGLQAALRVSSIPTTVIFNRKGEVVSRLNGFVPERFVDMLTERIRDTLAQP